MCLAISHSILSCSALQQGCIANARTLATQWSREPLFSLFYMPQQIFFKGEDAFVGGWVVAGVG
mgnify:CR=1 FL=1